MRKRKPLTRQPKLTVKQKRFVAEYLIDGNGTRAAIRAGYSAKTAGAIATENLTKPLIKAAVDAAAAERTKRAQIDADWVLRRLSEEANADLADLYTAENALKPIHEWPVIWRKGLIAGIDTAHEYEMVDGKKESIGTVVKLKVSDRIRRLELIGKHVAVSAFLEKHELQGKDGAPLIPPAMDDREIARRVAFLLAQGLQA